MEIRQDISTLRYELIDILRNNGMKTPTLNQADSSGKETLSRDGGSVVKSSDFSACGPGENLH